MPVQHSYASTMGNKDGEPHGSGAKAGTSFAGQQPSKTGKTSGSKLSLKSATKAKGLPKNKKVKSTDNVTNTRKPVERVRHNKPGKKFVLGNADGATTAGNFTVLDEYNCNACSKPDTADNMVACDYCENWFHYDCAGVSTSIANKSWHCQGCVSQDNDENDSDCDPEEDVVSDDNTSEQLNDID